MFESNNKACIINFDGDSTLTTECELTSSTSKSIEAQLDQMAQKLVSLEQKIDDNHAAMQQAVSDSEIVTLHLVNEKLVQIHEKIDLNTNKIDAQADDDNEFGSLLDGLQTSVEDNTFAHLRNKQLLDEVAAAPVVYPDLTLYLKNKGYVFPTSSPTSPTAPPTPPPTVHACDSGAHTCWQHSADSSKDAQCIKNGHLYSCHCLSEHGYEGNGESCTMTASPTPAPAPAGNMACTSKYPHRSHLVYYNNKCYGVMGDVHPTTNNLHGAGCDDTCQNLPSGFSLASENSATRQAILVGKQWETCAAVFSSSHTYWTMSNTLLTTNGLQDCGGGSYKVRYCYLRVMIEAPCIGCWDNY
jgi:hypothetical protein